MISITNETIRHNGIKYLTRSKIELEEDLANDLIKINSIQKTIEKPYPNLTNKEQIEYLTRLEENEVLARYDELSQTSKAQAKKFLDALREKLNSNEGPQE